MYKLHYMMWKRLHLVCIHHLMMGNVFILYTNTLYGVDTSLYGVHTSLYNVDTSLYMMCKLHYMMWKRLYMMYILII